MDNSNDPIYGILFFIGLLIIGFIYNWWQARSARTKTIGLIIVGLVCPITMFAAFHYSETVVNESQQPQTIAINELQDIARTTCEGIDQQSRVSRELPESFRVLFANESYNAYLPSERVSNDSNSRIIVICILDRTDRELDGAVYGYFSSFSTPRPSEIVYRCNRYSTRKEVYIVDSSDNTVLFRQMFTSDEPKECPEETNRNLRLAGSIPPRDIVDWVKESLEID